REIPLPLFLCPVLASNISSFAALIIKLLPLRCFSLKIFYCATFSINQALGFSFGEKVADRPDEGLRKPCHQSMISLASCSHLVANSSTSSLDC
ncbi:MAG: hypothetical protein VW876_10310, partial [Deltaproteobacteria bacterium]